MVVPLTKMRMSGGRMSLGRTKMSFVLNIPNLRYLQDIQVEMFNRKLGGNMELVFRSQLYVSGLVT